MLAGKISRALQICISAQVLASFHCWEFRKCVLDCVAISESECVRALKKVTERISNKGGGKCFREPGSCCFALKAGLVCVDSAQLSMMGN